VRSPTGSARAASRPRPTRTSPPRRPVVERSLARQAVHIAEETDFLSMQADTRVALAEVLTLAGRPAEDAEAPLREALDLYERKGNLAGSARPEGLLGQGGPVRAVASLDGAQEEA
jgi:hypothetical protein